MSTGHVEPSGAPSRRLRNSPTCIPMRSGDLAAVVEAARAGHEWAWTALITRFQPMVLRIARRHRLAATEQDEVAQETWLRLFRNLGRIDQPAALRGWIATTARNESVRRLHSCSRETPVEQDALPEPRMDPDMDASLVARERRAALDRALRRVPDRQARLLRILMTEPEPSYEQVSAALGIPIGSIGPTRARGIERLRGDVHLASALDARPATSGSRALHRHARRHQRTPERKTT
jgi:RNA polymerase sigma factor (sigma-70 family)